MTWVHHYVSTACAHAVGENKPELHAACRRSCKFAEDGVESCECPCHTGTPPEEMPPVGVDQARAIARRLYDEVPFLPSDLAEEIESDRDLWWLRGEKERPPGEEQS